MHEACVRACAAVTVYLPELTWRTVLLSTEIKRQVRGPWECELL